MPTRPPILAPPGGDFTWHWLRFNSASGGKFCLQTICGGGFNHSSYATLMPGYTAGFMALFSPVLSSDWKLTEIQSFGTAFGVHYFTDKYVSGIHGTAPAGSLPSSSSWMLYQVAPLFNRIWWRWHVGGISTAHVTGDRFNALGLSKQRAFATAFSDYVLHGHLFGGNTFTWSRKRGIVFGMFGPCRSNEKLGYMYKRRPRSTHAAWPVYPLVP
jgi:hypothetical protein